MKRFTEAYKMTTKQTETFNQLSTTFSPDVVEKWELMVTTWNANPKAQNPYAEPKCSKS